MTTTPVESIPYPDNSAAADLAATMKPPLDAAAARIKEVRDLAVADTGWVNVAAVNTWTSSVPGKGIQFRIRLGVVYLRGIAQCTNAAYGHGYAITTLPANARPDREVEIASTQVPFTSKTVTLRVDTSGQVYVPASYSSAPLAASDNVIFAGSFPL